LPNVIFAQNLLFGQTGQKNFSAYLSGKHQNLFLPLCLKHQILHQKAHSATDPLKTPILIQNLKKALP
jgi:hypothetical protein